MREWKHEVDAVLQGSLYYLSIWSSGYTYGQQLQNVTYQNGWAGDVAGKVPAARWQRVLMGAALILIPYAWNRGGDYVQQNDFPTVWRRWMSRLDSCWKVASVINFVAFLWTARYPTLVERLLALKMVHVSPHLTRSVAFEYMNRQLVWEGFTEFLLFIMPLIDFDRIQNAFRRRIAPANPLSPPSQCGICLADPIHNPHASDACGHVSCYYCIASQLQQDPSFPCPKCGVSTTSITRVLKRVEGKLV